MLRHMVKLQRAIGGCLGVRRR